MMEDRMMDKLTREFAKELYKIFGVIPDYDFENENRVLECVRKYSSYAEAIGYNKAGSENSNRKSISQIKDGKVIQTFDSSYDAARAVGVDSSSIRNAVNGVRKTCAGFEWKLATT